MHMQKVKVCSLIPNKMLIFNDAKDNSSAIQKSHSKLSH